MVGSRAPKSEIVIANFLRGAGSRRVSGENPALSAPRVDPNGPWRLATVGLGLAYCWLAVQLPMWIFAQGRHDDALFVRLGREISEGRWLGAYDQYTLMKGPGYPLFLAGNAWLGLPISFTHAILHCAAAGAAGWLVAQVGRSRRLGIAAGLCLLLLPVSIAPPLRRLFRDAIYAEQVVMALVLWGAAFCVARSRGARVAAGALAGLWTGWVWLSREEGVWLLPMLVVGVAVATLGQRRKESRWSTIGVVLLAASVAFLAVVGGFRLGNRIQYGKWVGVEIHDRDFRRALATLQGVRVGEPVRFVPVTRAAREAIYAISPAFAALRPHLDPPSGPVWQDGCAFYPETCGEIAGGWFLWALRGASARAGFHSTPATAAAHYRRVAVEVETACAAGTLHCEPRFFSFMPSVSSSQLANFPRRVVAAAGIVALWGREPDAGGASHGSRGEFERMLDFVHHPAHLPLESEASRIWMSGWFHRRGDAWFRAHLERADGVVEQLVVERRPSEGLEAYFRDPRARRQRFRAQGDCDLSCILVVVGDGGAEARIPLSQVAGGGRGVPVGTGAIHFDEMEFESDGRAEQPRTTAMAMFSGLWTVYRWLLAPTLVAGLIAFAAVAVRAARRAGPDPLFGLAVVAWCGVATRIVVVVAIDVSAFPALRLHYLSPATPLALFAAVLSIALARRLFGPARTPASPPGGGSL